MTRLEVIYVTRHGFRSNWLVNPSTGDYTAAIKSPTGIPADPALTAHGVDQAKELAAHLSTLDPPVERVYSSPYYRCLQTVEPFVSLGHQARQRGGEEASSPGRFLIRAETGLSEWYGSAPFEHPTSASSDVLKPLFPDLDDSYASLVAPSRMGETIEQLHDRVAATLDGLIGQCDEEGVRAILLCSHAATIIALGRVLTGHMPDKVEAEDFRAFTCGLSVYRRRGSAMADQPKRPADRRHAPSFLGFEGGRAVAPQGSPVAPEESPGTEIGGSGWPLSTHSPLSWDESASDVDPGRVRGDHFPPHAVAWKEGRGVRGGWVCEVNGDCSFLSGGEERGWRFSGDESFGPATSKSGLLQVDAGAELGVVVEGSRAEKARHTPGDSHL